MQFSQRVIGCFKALAIGDAIGKQTETLSRADVQRWYPGGIAGFHGQPGDVIPRYAGKRYEWRIGETTDDTEQTLAVARALLRDRRATHQAIGQELLHCKKSLHPGVSLWTFVQLGDPSRIASDGDGCGAAMRAAPVGVLYPSSRLHELIRGAYECAIPTHGGQMAVCAAAAVAGAVSAALDGRPVGEVLTIAIQASTGAEGLRRCAEASIAVFIQEIYSDLAKRKHLVVDEIASQYFPNKPQNIVPLAISLALVTESAQQTALLAANIGGDSDSVASMGSAIAGALHPETVNEEWFEVVNMINDAELLNTAKSLAALRHNA
jgi:ADP-ribosylglycohydrolase